MLRKQRRSEKQRKVKEETISSLSFCVDKYQDGRIYHTFRGLFRHQNSANCVRNKSEAAESKLIVTKVVMSNRSKHISNNFEARQVFSTENAKNLAIEQSFDDVIDDDDENMEPLISEPL